MNHLLQCPTSVTIPLRRNYGQQEQLIYIWKVRNRLTVILWDTWMNVELLFNNSRVGITRSSTWWTNHCTSISNSIVAETVRVFSSYCQWCIQQVTSSCLLFQYCTYRYVVDVTVDSMSCPRSPSWRSRWKSGRCGNSVERKRRFNVRNDRVLNFEWKNKRRKLHWSVLIITITPHKYS